MVGIFAAAREHSASGVTMSDRLVDIVATFSDEQSEACLKTVIQGLVERDEVVRALVAHQQATDILRDAQGAGQATDIIAEPAPSPERVQAIRFIVREMAVDPMTAGLVDGYQRSHRPVLLEPVTTALVLTGIVLVLSAEVRIEHTKSGGRAKTRVVIVKKATAPGILKRFFTILGR
jgi:hypothetical protein